MAGNDIIHAASISPQVLVSQQLGTTDAALYTVASGQSVKVAHGVLCNVTGTMPAPVLTLGTTASSGGTFAAGPYFWKVTAKNSAGETLGSNEVTATLAINGTQALSWNIINGAVSYNLYRGTSAGNENAFIVNTGATSYTDTGTVGSTASPPTSQSTATPVIVYVSIIKNGGTVGDNTHRVLSSYTLAANDSFSLHDYLGGAMLGPGDAIAAYAQYYGAVDIVVSGTVHA